MSETTLARNLWLVLHELKPAIQDTSLTLDQAWVSTLGTNGNEQLYEALRLLSGAVGMLEHQVRASAVLRDSRAVHLSNLTEVRKLLHPAHLSASAKALADCVAGHRLDLLWTLSDALRLTFPEGMLDTKDQDKVTRHLDEALKTVQASDLDDRLKDTITTHLDTIRWAVRNVDKLGVDAVMEVLMVALTKIRAEAAKNPKDAEKPVFGKAVAAGKKVMDVLDGATKAYRNVEKLSELVGPIFDKLPPAGGAE